MKISQSEVRDSKDTIIYTIGAACLTLQGELKVSVLFALPEWLDLLLQGVFLLCMCYLIITQRTEKQTMLFFSIIGVLCLYTYRIIHYGYFLTTFLCIWALRGISLKYVIKCKMQLTAVFLGIHVAAFFVIKLGIPGILTYVYRGGVQRDTLLLTHSNLFSMFTAWTIYEYIYLYYEDMGMKQYVVIVLITIFIKKITDTNTFPITLAVVLILIYLEKNKKWLFEKIAEGISGYGILLFSFFFSALTALYTNLRGGALTFYQLLNRFFTGRLLYGAVTYDTHGWTLFGQVLHFSEKTCWRGIWFDEIYFDNAYIGAFVQNGFFYMIVIGVAFVYIRKKTSPIEKILITAYALYGVMEIYIVNAMFCFPVLLIGQYIYGTKGSGNKKRKNPDFKCRKGNAVW